MSQTKPKRADRFWHLLNDITAALLRSPLHRLLSRNVLVLTFTGRKTGRRITTPVSYARVDDAVLCVTPSAWANNLRANPAVTLVLRGRVMQGAAEVFPPGAPASIDLLRAFFQRVPRDMRFYSVHSAPDGTPDLADLQRVAAKVFIMRISLASSR